MIRELREGELEWANAVYASIGFAASTREHLLLVEEREDGARVGLGRVVWIGDRDCEIGGIWTAPEARGGGVARTIVEALLARAAGAAGAARTVWCIPYAHLAGFYESCGLRRAPPPWPREIDEKVRGLRDGGVAVEVLRRLRDGYHELNGPYELVGVRDGMPVRYCSLSQQLPDAEEERAIAAMIEAFTGVAVRLEGWELEVGDPRDSGRVANVVVGGGGGGGGETGETGASERS